MKLLLDESIPRQLARFFPGLLEVCTAQRVGWTGSKNGALSRLAADHGFDALITADQRIEYQQNLNNFPIPVIVMIAYRTRVQELQSLVPEVADILTCPRVSCGSIATEDPNCRKVGRS